MNWLFWRNDRVYIGRREARVMPESQGVIYIKTKSPIS